jgi:hypothetical protein
LTRSAPRRSFCNDEGKLAQIMRAGHEMAEEMTARQKQPNANGREPREARGRR